MDKMTKYASVVLSCYVGELSGDNIKIHAAEVGAAGKKALEQGESRARTLPGMLNLGASGWRREAEECSL